MNKGTFWNSVNDAVKLLKKLNFIREVNIHKNFSYSQKEISHPQIEIHEDIYNELLYSQDYDMLLYDYSILQLSIDDNENIRMLFVQNPRLFISFEDFLTQMDLPFTNTNIARLRYDFKEDYDQFLSEQKAVANPTYFRYETDYVNRRDNENIHSFAHLHVGLNNCIRFPVGIDITPYAFVIFVIRHSYYDDWVNIIRKGLLDDNELNYKTRCGHLPNDLWTDKEKRSLHFS